MYTMVITSTLYILETTITLHLNYDQVQAKSSARFSP